MAPSRCAERASILRANSNKAWEGLPTAHQGLAYAYLGTPEWTMPLEDLTAPRFESREREVEVIFHPLV